ncbi:MAG: hypothetical protein AAFV43_12100 [Planctomycetota bacterium]
MIDDDAGFGADRAENLADLELVAGELAFAAQPVRREHEPSFAPHRFEQLDGFRRKRHQLDLARLLRPGIERQDAATAVEQCPHAASLLIPAQGQRLAQAKPRPPQSAEHVPPRLGWGISHHVRDGVEQSIELLAGNRPPLHLRAGVPRHLDLGNLRQQLVLAGPTSDRLEAA